MFSAHGATGTGAKPQRGCGELRRQVEWPASAQPRLLREREPASVKPRRIRQVARPATAEPIRVRRTAAGLRRRQRRTCPRRCEPPFAANRRPTTPSVRADRGRSDTARGAAQNGCNIALSVRSSQARRPRTFDESQAYGREAAALRRGVHVIRERKSLRQPSLSTESRRTKDVAVRNF
jgi:hypothetical protein